MRRCLVTLTVLMSLALFTGPGAALASTERHTNSDWRGVTEKGDDLRMLVVRTAPGESWVIPWWEYDITVVCDDGSEYSANQGFIGFNFPITDGYGEFRYRPIIWTGNFSHDRAHGTVQWTDSQCDSGVLTWTAEHLHPPGYTGQSSPSKSSFSSLTSTT